LLLVKKTIGPALALVLLLRGSEGTELRIPVCFQGISDETVVRIDAQVAALG